MIDKDFLNYFMKPQTIIGIGKVYPVKLYLYNEFKELSAKYMLAGRKWLTNICKYPKGEYILDFFVKNALMFESFKIGIIADEIKDQVNVIDELDMIRYDIEEMCRLFAITLNNEVEFELLDITNEMVDYRFKIKGTNNFITKFNYEQYRELVMEQNILFEPLISPSEKGNEVIQNAIRVLSKNGVSMDLMSVCSAVSTYKGITDEELQEYTYYRLMYDFETINRINNNLIYAMFMAQGSKEAKLTYLGENVNLNKNPYDGLLRRNGDNQLTKRLQQGH